ncbi:hypothetical protein [Streptomyces eurocidicus]|uniref:DUF3800 domain-containing protein n=1 Tax=Streptomyces eurocidicus TaxID=66423 RepID=A0A7W8F4R3_STREU|nr:hypothetical protein [Streptomyces eurocidicus]MBB5121309.1 hypothetical protein [Streptomyces eurocidicus]MBF6055914.1 hypothetical protein [Streptomyces eurocidicus]
MDDGGDSRRLALLGWLRVALGRTSGPLGHWQAFRSELHADPFLDIRPGDALHAVSLAAGRGRPVYGVRREPGTSAKQPYRDVVRRALGTIGTMPGVTAGSSYRTGAPGDPFGRTKQGLYEAWVRHVDAAHAAAGTHAFIVFDGNGTETGLRGAHHRLPGPRHVIGDPCLIPARHNPLLQAADQIAYASYQKLARRPQRRFMWDWLDEHIPQAEGPIRL